MLVAVIDYGVLIVLSQFFSVNPVLAAGISFCASLVFNHLASMRFVFSYREELSVSSEFAFFSSLSVIGLGLNEVIMWIGTRALGSGALAVTLVNTVGMAVVMVWNFVSRKIRLDGAVAKRAASRDCSITLPA